MFTTYTLKFKWLSLFCHIRPDLEFISKGFKPVRDLCQTYNNRYLVSW